MRKDLGRAGGHGVVAVFFAFLFVKNKKRLTESENWDRIVGVVMEVFFVNRHLGVPVNEGWRKELGRVVRMKCFMFRVVLAVAVMVVISRVSFAGAEWVDITGDLAAIEDITCIEGGDGTDVIYAGTSGGVYVSRDTGRTWKREHLSVFGPRVTGISSFDGSVFAAADEGLFIKEGKSDEWRRMPGEKDLKGVCAYGDVLTAVTWTSARVFLVAEGSWRDISPRAMRGDIEKVTVVLDTLYLSCGGEIIYGKAGSDEWNRSVLVLGGDEESRENVEIENDNENSFIKLIRDVTPMRQGGSLVATGKGIYIVGDPALGQMPIDTTGLPAEKIVTALSVEGGILAATDIKVFFKPENAYSWRSVLEVSDRGYLREIKTHRASNGTERIFLVFSKGIYVSDFVGGFQGEIESPVCEEQFFLGPDIGDVHDMAIEYAEVSPDKIEGWRKAARWRAVLPRLVFGYDENYSDNTEIYKSSTRTYLVTGPRDRRDGWDVTLTWDLPDLIWNSAQTSIDVRSKLMVQLRDDILEDITRLYFERKRLIEDVSMKVEKDRAKVCLQKNRIEELTAYIDAYTGGMFSRSLDSRVEM